MYIKKNKPVKTRPGSGRSPGGGGAYERAQPALAPEKRRPTLVGRTGTFPRPRPGCVKKPTWGVARKSLFYNELAVFRVSKTSTLKTAYYLIANDLRTTPNVSNARLHVGANQPHNSPERVKNSTPRHRKGVGTRKKVTWKTSITSAKWRACPSLPDSRRQYRSSW